MTNRLISWGVYHPPTETTIHADDAFRMAVPWGVFGPGGLWGANPLLKLSADEQYRQNVANGFLPKAK
jgi:hypothetical protein